MLLQLRNYSTDPALRSVRMIPHTREHNARHTQRYSKVVCQPNSVRMHSTAYKYIRALDNMDSGNTLIGSRSFSPLSSDYQYSMSKHDPLTIADDLLDMSTTLKRTAKQLMKGEEKQPSEVH